MKALGIEPGLDAGVWVGCKEERTTQTHCAGSVWAGKLDVVLVPSKECLTGFLRT